MIDIDTALQFAVVVLMAELRKPDTESILDPLCEKYHVAPQDRAMLLNHIHAVSPFVQMFSHYRVSTEISDFSRKEIATDAIRALRDLQRQRHTQEQAFSEVEKRARTQPLPPIFEKRP